MTSFSYRCHCRASVHTVSRRQTLMALLALGGASAFGGLVGCDDAAQSTKNVVPIEIGAATSCELDGMLLADYPGPKAQIHYVGKAEPAFFCDTIEMFRMVLVPEQIQAIQAIFVQDMGLADWDQPKGHWFDARTGFYVLGSQRRGSMGPTIASFRQEADAQKFVATYAGKVLPFTAIKADMVDLSGGALHDNRM